MAFWKLFAVTGLLLGHGVLLQAAQSPVLSGEHQEFFERKIRPVLVDRCYKCHSATGEKFKGGLRVDSREGFLQGGDTGPAVEPGKPEKSLLIKALRYTDKDLQMPPKEPLSSEQVKDFETWVKMGLPDPRQGSASTVTNAQAKTGYDWEKERQFWAFQAVKNPPVPKVRHKDWSRNPIDAFIMAQLEARKLEPARPAEPRTWLRRVTYDLTGLPPSIAEMEAFLADRSPQAKEIVIDRLLASPQYGEQWGRHWLDVVRYADTSGCNSDFPIPSAHKYRNYVIGSFNADKPYDQFVREQLAGDLLPSKTETERFEKIIATGYLAISRRFGSRANEFHLTIEDTIDNLGKTVLGLSVSCARCHDHKFDPIPTRDYYALYGIFQSTQYAFPGTEIYPHPKDFIPLTEPDQAREILDLGRESARLDDTIEKLKEEVKALERVVAKEEKKEGTPQPAPNPTQPVRTVQQAKNELEEARARQKQMVEKQGNYDRAYAVAEGKAGPAKIQKKGDPSALGEMVPRGFLQVLGGQTVPEAEKGSGRLELAQWLTDRNNPLTARVMVNRLWQHHFGRGLVQSPNDFGVRGKAPTHPELLDFLATRFMEEGWSVKAMHKRMLLSRTYGLSSEDHPGNAAKDVNNDSLWRFNRHRLGAEELRDAMLALSGALENSMAGEHPFPPESKWKYTQHTPFVANYATDHRSIYLMQQRIKRQPFLEAFDGADPNATTGERSLSTTAIQALYLMNSPFTHEQADKLAARVAQSHAAEEKQIDHAYQLAYGRPASRQEIGLARDFLKQCRQELQRTGLSAEAQPRAALASFMRVVYGSNEFMFVD